MSDNLVLEPGGSVASAARTDAPPAIVMDKVNKWFGALHVLRDVSLQGALGERVVVCGPSGSGKSTMIRCVNRLETHQEGRIVVDGIELSDDVKALDAIRREVGMVFQSFNLFPHLTTLENCTLAPIWVRRMPKKQAEELAMEYLTRVRIPEQAKKYPGQLSGGQQQRVAIARATAQPHAAQSRAVTLPLPLGVLGVVYGDIGTSPLYALRAALLHFAADGVERGEIFGVLSLIIWALLLTVTVKYVFFVLRADNRGEGGVLALMALAQRVARTPRGGRLVALLGIAGAALFFGDGCITPAISVLSAVEGLKVISHTFEEAVIPISVDVLLALFLVQYRGTQQMGAVFGPVMALWFGTLGLLGLVEIFTAPEVLGAVSPHHAALFLAAHPFAAFIAMGSVVLAVTGAEALYADMGHFGRRPIKVGWIWFVLPAIMLNYFGQG